MKGLKLGSMFFLSCFVRTLPLDVTLTQPDIYLEQERDGEWINLDFLKSDKEKKEPLIYFDVDIDSRRSGHNCRTLRTESPSGAVGW